MAALIFLMTAATVLEKLKGTPAAFDAVYHNPVFIALWAVAAVSGLAYLFSKKMWKKFFTMLLHFSFVVILLGALVTFLTGERGSMHLSVGEPQQIWTLSDGTERELPFPLVLDNFRVEYYPGSEAPADYESTVRVLPGEPRTISMNNILKHDGYRFYQSDFDPDRRGSTLAVSHDPWGIGITYAGYLLLLLSMIGFFFQKNTGFRAVVKRLSAAAAVLLLFALPAGAESKSGASEEEDPMVIPAEVAEAFEGLFVYYNDRIAPFGTMARDYCLKAYGKSRYGPYSATQVVTGWLFRYDWWRGVPMKVKKKDRGTPAEGEKEYLLRTVASGQALKIFPVAVPDSLSSEERIAWFDCTSMLPEYAFGNYDLWVFIRKALDLVADRMETGDTAEAVRVVSKIGEYQRKTAAEVLPSEKKVRAELLYNRISRPMVPFMASITLGILLFILSELWISRGKKTPKGLQRALAVLSALLTVYLAVVLGLRWYVSGHAPFAGSYSVMMLIAFLSALAMTLLYRKFPLIQPLGFLLSGFTMLMASMASANPRITHLMPVLQSPLLSVHVLAMMISYTLFGLVALNGIMGLLVPKGGPKEHLRDISLVILYPAVFLLTIGTFLGAVWANISWGSYWAWDPKETWALVTVLVYAAALHGGSLGSVAPDGRTKGFRNPQFFHWFSVFAFLTVLITYFGVNLILGGMHAYA